MNSRKVQYEFLKSTELTLEKYIMNLNSIKSREVHNELNICKKYTLEKYRMNSRKTQNEL